MIEDLKPLLGKLAIYAKDRFGFKEPPRLFLKQDKENSQCALGKTAHYDPVEKSVTIFVSNRHPKDILRSFVHELVHHCQNLRGDLAPEKMKTMNRNYAQENEHMRKMEQEAYLEGNMCFRDWEDGLENKLQYKLTIAEQKFLKENKNMSVKISKKELKSLIEKFLGERKTGGLGVKDALKSAVQKEDSAPNEEPLSETEEEIEEGGCGGHSSKKKDKYMMDESDVEEINEEEEEEEEEEEFTEVVTPEQRNALYEERFSPRNNKLFERLVKKWTK
jgi:hypothetical protein